MGQLQQLIVMDGAREVAYVATTKFEKESLLLDAAKRRFGLRSDNALAKTLNVSRMMMSLVRAGTCGIGVTNKIKLLDRLAFVPTRNLEASLEVPNLILEVHALCQAKYRTALPAIPDRPDPLLLDLCRQAFEVPSDNKLARFLGVAQSTIAMIRSEKLRLGVLTRLRILSVVCSDVPYESIERALSSTPFLIEQLEPAIA